MKLQIIAVCPRCKVGGLVETDVTLNENARYIIHQHFGIAYGTYQGLYQDGISIVPKEYYLCEKCKKDFAEFEIDQAKARDAFMEGAIDEN